MAFVDSRVGRMGLYLLTGISMFAYWVVVRPTAQASPTQSQWPYVLWFSGTILTLAFAIPVLGRMIGGKWIVRLAIVAGAAAAWNSAVNIIEDGLGQDWAFVLFAIGAAGLLVSLLALAVAIAVRVVGNRRAVALIPLGTAAGILLFVQIGGPLMLVTWCAAAASAVRWRPEWTEEPATVGPAKEAPLGNEGGGA